MKPAHLSQLMAAPLASIFLILSLWAMKMNQRETAGETIFETYVEDSEAPACSGDTRSYFFHIHANQTGTVNGHDVPLIEAYRYIEKVMEPRAERAIFLSADPDAAIGDVERAMDHLQSRSPGLLFFRYSSSERHHFDDPRNNFDCMVPRNLSSILGPPPVRSYFPPVEYQ